MLLLLFFVRIEENTQVFMFLKTFKHCIVHHMKSNSDVYEMLKYSRYVSDMLIQAETSCMKISLEKNVNKRGALVMVSTGC